MPIPSAIVKSARRFWKWEWMNLMNGLAPSDKKGNFCRVPSQKLTTSIPVSSDLMGRAKEDLPILIVGRSCPWAHRTWLMFELKNLKDQINLIFARADHSAGRWAIEPAWHGLKTLDEIYKKCQMPAKFKSTVPVLIDPKPSKHKHPEILGNESSELVIALNNWPLNQDQIDLNPSYLIEEINYWQNMIQLSVNDGVYRCGFARNQSAYNKASNELFKAINFIEKKLSQKGPWLCGEHLTIADVRLFPTLIRWEMVYSPLFRCSKVPLWNFPNTWEWRKKFASIPNVTKTIDSEAWRTDYFGALFPLNPSNIIPDGPDIMTLINSKISF